jgi:hypothetical protein
MPLFDGGSGKLDPETGDDDFTGSGSGGNGIPLEAGLMDPLLAGRFGGICGTPTGSGRGGKAVRAEDPEPICGGGRASIRGGGRASIRGGGSASIRGGGKGELAPDAASIRVFGGNAAEFTAPIRGAAPSESR